jgi:threonine dehydrogenase-like Zn-dependent dehydrogenase
VIRNRFSLTGTLGEKSLLGLLPDSLGLPLHPGYASVGVVEEVASTHSRLEAGDVVVMPACYSTYVALPPTRVSDSQGFFLQRISANTDMVDATFATLAGLSLYLARQTPRTTKMPVVLLGCGLLGAVLSRVLRLENVRAFVCADQADLQSELILASGAEAVLSCEQPFPRELLETAQAVFILSSSDWCSRIVSTLSSVRERPFVVTAVSNDHQGAGKRYPWLGYDVLGEALALLRDGELVVRDLVAQHVHAEAVEQVYRAIQQNRYRGRALVYDW